MQAGDEKSSANLRSSYLEYLPALFRRELVVDPDTRRVWVAGNEVRLREAEFAVLVFLYEREGRTCTEEEIAENVGARYLESGIASGEPIAQIIQSIRKIIEPDPSSPRYLKSVDGGAYRLDSDEFMGRFLMIFESILKPIENAVDNAALYFDPLMTPEPLLPWLASWIDFVLAPEWSEEQRRKLVKWAAQLYRWRGTKRGLTEYLRLYTGSIPEISEYIPGMRLDADTRLGVNTQLGSSGGGYHFTVTLELDENSQIDAGRVKAIIDAQKPAHTVYTLQIIKGNNKEAEENNGA